MTVHANSAQAFHLLDQKTRIAAVLAAYDNGACLTDREVCERLGFGENTNAVRPRITTLVETGKLVEIGSGIDHVTGRKVRICAVPS